MDHVILTSCRTIHVYDSASAQVIYRSLAAGNLQLNITTIPPTIPPYEPYVQSFYYQAYYRTAAAISNLQTSITLF
jgi:hypothetical protein